MNKYIAFLLLITGILLTGCANPGSGPDGGPYDETPPKILSMSPDLGQTNVKSAKVTITFDELIKVNNAQEKITISPPQIEMPEIKTSGRKISVELLDTLKENTTYTVDFSDAIVDNNEGNPLGNFTYYFSTGERLDTMEVAGHVLQAENLEPVKGIMVGLHSELADSAFWSFPFDRVARTDGNGHFSIKGVAPGKYRIYALKDMDNDFRYSRGEMLASGKDTIIPSSFPDIRHDTIWADTVHIDSIRQVPYTHYMPDNVVLLAYNEKNKIRQLLKVEREPAFFKIYFTAESDKVPTCKGLNFDERDAFLIERSQGNDTLTYWLRDSVLVNTDTLQIAYTYEAVNDSTLLPFLKTDTLELIPRQTYEKRQKQKANEYVQWKKGLEKRHKRGDFSEEVPPVKLMTIKFGNQGSIAPDKNVRLTLPEPLARLDTAGIHLYLQVDSNYVEAAYRLERDSLSLLNYTLRAEWRPSQEYVLNVDSACMTGLSGIQNKAGDINISVKSDDTMGALFLLLPDADSTALVQLFQGSDRVVKQQWIKDGRADFFYLEPSDYYVRIINDRNHNGKWDAGDYREGITPEEVYYYPQKFNIRANWDIEQTWRIADTPIYLQKPRELIKQKEETKKTPKNRNAERERQKRGG